MLVVVAAAVPLMSGLGLRLMDVGLGVTGEGLRWVRVNVRAWVLKDRGRLWG